MEVEIDTVTVVGSLLRDWKHNDLSWGDPEWPLAAEMLDEDGEESLDGAENSSMDHDRSLEAWLEWLLLPGVLLWVMLVWLVLL